MTAPGLTIKDCVDVLHAAGTDMVLMGGQAVGIWANEFAEELQLEQPLVSKDIDFWGDRQRLINLAQKLGTKPEFPDRRMMTLLSGLTEKRIKGEWIRIDVLHTVPGLDVVDEEKAGVEFRFAGKTIAVLDPVSLVACKFYNLQNFDQDGRNDEAQLRVCLKLAKIYIGKAFTSGYVRTGLNYCKRILNIALRGSSQATIKKHSLRMFDAIPISQIQSLAKDSTQPEEARNRLKNFLEIRWARLAAGGAVS
jgi:hypothetical protein